MYYTVFNVNRGKLKTIQARIPEPIFDEIEERIETGTYASVSEIVRDALRRLIAEQSRAVLREMTKRSGITEDELMNKLNKIRD